MTEAERASAGDVGAEGDADDEERQEEESREAIAERLNPELLRACMKNATEECLQLIEQGADPTCEDSRQWSPLIWAACHGNETLCRLLIRSGAANVYKYEEAEGASRGKKHSPLHWAAFKGHLKVLWLLLGQNLSPHERDTIGNTVLHQAAAGGDLGCTKCLLAQGVDVYSKNDRGHTPYDLCTAPEVQQLLQKAMGVTACKATGKQFSSTVMRYMCSWSLDFLCDGAVTKTFVYDSPDSEFKEKPATWCLDVRNTILEAEHQLAHAMQLNQLDAISQALVAAQDKPVDVKSFAKCEQVKAKLESEIQLNTVMQVQTVTQLEEFAAVQENLTKAIDVASAEGADPALIVRAKTLRRRLLSEASLTRAVETPTKTSDAHLKMLEWLTDAAKAEDANADLLARATKLIRKLKSEREVNQRLTEASRVAGQKSLKDAEESKEELPEWFQGTDQFEVFQENYKAAIENAETDEIAPFLLASAKEQLAALEDLLVEKKQVEEELRLKANKKKKGAKK